MIQSPINMPWSLILRTRVSRFSCDAGNQLQMWLIGSDRPDSLKTVYGSVDCDCNSPIQLLDEVAYFILGDSAVVAHVAVVCQHQHRQPARHLQQLTLYVIIRPATSTKAMQITGIRAQNILCQCLQMPLRN
jgi:hypothetical protein